MSSPLETPVRYTASRIIRAKSSPTTQVTTIEPDWDRMFQDQETAVYKDRSICNASKSKSSFRDSASTSHNAATISHGLLTPHASISETLADQDYYTAQSSFQSTDNIGYVSDISEIRFASRDESDLLGDELCLCHLSQSETRGSSSCGRVSYASVGVQTSLPHTSPSYASTRPPSPISPTATPTASPKRKRKGTPEYIREGAKLAQELDDDLIYLSQEKRRLERSLALVKRKERDHRSLLVPLPGEPAEKVSDDSTSDEDSDSDRRVLFTQRMPLTPASSDLENGARPQTKYPRPSSSKPALLSGQSNISESRHATTRTVPEDGPIVRENSKSIHADGMQRVPSYTFAEGTVTSDSSTSIEERAQKSYNESLAPNPVRDPSSYLVWFDLETTDAVRPAAHIRILEVAIFVSDKNYQPLDRGKSFLVHWPLSAEEVALEMPERVRDMHNRSGLLHAYANTPAKERLTLAQVERRICKYLERHDIGTDGRAIMAGAGVAFDRGMVRQHMEKLNSYFSHQIFDTTTLWHFVRRKYSRTKRFSEMCVHRAMDDILESCREARIYSELVLKTSGDVHWPTQSSNGI